MSDIGDRIDALGNALVNATEQEINYVVDSLINNGMRDTSFDILLKNMTTTELIEALRLVNERLKVLNKDNADWMMLQRDLIRTAVTSAILLAKDKL